MFKPSDPGISVEKPCRLPQMGIEIRACPGRPRDGLRMNLNYRRRNKRRQRLGFDEDEESSYPAAQRLGNN